MIKKILLNADGKVLTSNDKVLKAPETVNVIKTLLDGRKEANYLFHYYDGESVEHLISYSCTENVTGMIYMFYGCTNLQTIPQLDTSKVTDMAYMFSGCYNLQTIPQLDTSKVTNMANMIRNCPSLQTIPQLNTSNVTDMVNMFRDCSSLQTIDITSMDKLTSTINSSYMCYGCSSLTKLIIRTMTRVPSLNSNSFNNCYHFDGTFDATYNPDGLKDGRIYVPDDMVESLKSATNWSAYADIIVPLSSLEE